MDTVAKLPAEDASFPIRRLRPSRAQAEDVVQALIEWAEDALDREGLLGTPRERAV